MTQLYREIRVTERKMQKFRAMTARHGRPSVRSLAEEIWESFAEKPIAKTLSDFVPSEAKTEIVALPATKGSAVLNDMFNPSSLKFGAHYISLGAPERVEYGLQLSENGISGQVAIPLDPETTKSALGAFRVHVEELRETFTSEAASYTADEQMQERIVREPWKKAGGS